MFATKSEQVDLYSLVYNNDVCLRHTNLSMLQD